MDMLSKLRSYSRAVKTKPVVFRVNEAEFAVLKEKAQQFTGGNYSDFLRHAIMRWKPELTEEEKEYASISD